MKRRIISTLCALALCLTLLPVMALAGNAITIDGIEYTVDSKLESGSGQLLLDTDTPTVPTCYPTASGEAGKDQYILFQPGTGGATVVLHNAALSASSDPCLRLPGGTTILLEGSSTLENTQSKNRVILVPEGDLTVKGPGTLSTQTGSGIAVSKGALTICEGATLNISYSGTGNGLFCNLGAMMIQNSTVTAKNTNPQSGGNGAIFANAQSGSSSSGVDSSIYIQNSIVTAIDEKAPAIYSSFGSVELESSTVTAMGYSTRYAVGAIAYSTSSGHFSIDGGVLYVKNQATYTSGNYDITYSPSKMSSANNAVIYYGNGYYNLMTHSDGSVIAYGNCTFDASGALDEESLGTGHVYGTVDASALPDTPISVENGGTLTVSAGETLTKDESLAVKQGGTLVNSGTFTSSYGLTNYGTITGSGTLNAVVKTSAASSGGTVYTYTSHGNAVYEEDFVNIGTDSSGDNKISVPAGTTLTIPAGQTLDATKSPVDVDNLNEYLNILGKLVVEGTLILPQGITQEQVSDLHLAGTGNVQVPDGTGSSSLKKVAFSSDGEIATTAFVLSGRPIPKPDIKKDNYTLKGWYRENSYQTLWNFETDLVEEDLTLYAKWTPVAVVPDAPVISSGSDDSGYSVSVPASSSIQGGAITVSPRSAEKGDTVTITVKPDSGYVLKELTASVRNGGEVPLSLKNDTQYTFQMPDGSVVIDVAFTAEGGIAETKKAFSDVPADFWACDEIAWAFENGYMNGTSATAFSPNGTVSRQQVWMILARMAGENPADMAGAKAWAVSNGISDGTNPGTPVSRQQLATLLYRYAVQNGYDVSVGESTNLLSYTDVAQLSEYAVPAMQWACGAGIINGTGDGSTLSPQGVSTRAQLAVMLYRWLA